MRMKYIKSFLQKYYKKNKLPIEVDKLGDNLTNFIQKNFKNILVKKYIFKRFDKSDSPIVGIHAGYILPKHNLYPNSVHDDEKIIGLYYNKNTKLVMYVFIKRYDFMNNMQLFLDNIMDKYAVDIFYLPNLKEGNRYWISIDKIDTIINELTQENYKLFLSTKKYNL